MEEREAIPNYLRLNSLSFGTSTAEIQKPRSRLTQTAKMRLRRMKRLWCDKEFSIPMLLAVDGPSAKSRLSGGYSIVVVGKVVMRPSIKDYQ